MSAATFRFYGELESFLPREQRGLAFLHSYARAATLKQAIESLGVPHTEIGRLLVNDQPATLARTVRDNDCVDVVVDGDADDLVGLRLAEVRRDL